jgi:hypothetical protein
VLTASVLSQVAADYLAANSDQDGAAPGKKDRNDAAFAWLMAWLSSSGVTLDLTTQALGIIADGYLIGAASAAAMVDGTTTPDLGEWKPGDSAAASDRIGALGLTPPPPVQGTDAAGRIAGGILAALARALAGTDGSATAGALGAALGAVVADAALITGLIVAELYTATATAASDYYPDHYEGLFAWVTDPTLMNCVICLDNEAAPPRAWGEPWPSGDTAPGIHVKCGCALVPEAAR